MEDHDYQGSATVILEDQEVTVDVALRGHFQPIDGRFHWYGRVSGNAALEELVQGRKKAITVRTAVGEAPASLSDPDPWGRYRITGTGTPPFDLATELDEAR